MKFKSISSDLLVTIVTLVAAFAAVTAAMAYQQPGPGFERYDQAYPEPYAYPLAQNTARVSVASDGAQADGNSFEASMSADGRFVAFHSYASNLVANDTNRVLDIFVHDRLSGETTRASLASDGTQANGDSYEASISADGRYVAFFSNASNLVAGDTNEMEDIFVYDRQSGETSRISLASDGAQANSHSSSPTISADGRYVAFVSSASNLVVDDTNGDADIFVHDRQSGETTRISLASDGSQANNDSYEAAISADGRYVAFESYANNLVAGDTNEKEDVFVHDRQTGETTRVSLASNGIQANDLSVAPSISADGRHVAFLSYARNLVVGDTNRALDIFIHDRQTGETTRVSVASDGTQADDDSYGASISADGRYVAFTSESSNLIPGDTNGVDDIFVHDCQSSTTIRTPNSPSEFQTNYYSYTPAISGNGRMIIFTSYASNLVVGDTNGFDDVFVYENLGKLAPAVGTSDVSLAPTLSWQASASAASYEYCYSSAPGPCTKWNSVGTDTSVTLSGLAPNYTYYWQVRAVNPGGVIEADNATWWSFTTTTAPSCTFAPYTPPSTPSFVDVPLDHWASNWIERYKSAGLTTGCNWVPGGYCPGDTVNREQMAVFIMRAKNCGSYTPATVTSAVFSDVPADHWAAGFIRDFRDAKITTGCAWVPGGYCPGDPVNREQMAVFVIRALHGGTYSPPAVTTPVFTDVPANHWAAPFIEQFYDEGITTGCNWVPGGFCPGDLVTREQMAVFIGRAFALP